MTKDFLFVTFFRLTSSNNFLLLSGFDVEAVNKGSIVIQLSPQTPDSWKRLEENCLSGKIKDFIPKVYDNADIYDMLKEGEYSLQFTIYTLPSPPDTKGMKSMDECNTILMPLKYRLLG